MMTTGFLLSSGMILKNSWAGSAGEEGGIDLELFEDRLDETGGGEAGAADVERGVAIGVQGGDEGGESDRLQVLVLAAVAAEAGLVEHLDDPFLPGDVPPCLARPHHLVRPLVHLHQLGLDGEPAAHAPAGSPCSTINEPCDVAFRQLAHLWVVSQHRLSPREPGVAAIGGSNLPVRRSTTPLAARRPPASRDSAAQARPWRATSAGNRAA